jgi:hypothetical protein
MTDPWDLQENVKSDLRGIKKTGERSDRSERRREMRYSRCPD